MRRLVKAQACVSSSSIPEPSIAGGTKGSLEASGGLFGASPAALARSTAVLKLLPSINEVLSLGLGSLRQTGHLFVRRVVWECSDAQLCHGPDTNVLQHRVTAGSVTTEPEMGQTKLLSCALRIASFVATRSELAEKKYDMPPSLLSAMSEEAIVVGDGWFLLWKAKTSF